MMANFDITTPIGKGTIVGMSPDHKLILVMHTYNEKKGTYARWWSWDDQKGAIIEHRNEDIKSDREDGTGNAISGGAAEKTG